jgi:hypothetical protein
MPGIDQPGNASLDVINSIANSTGIDQAFILINTQIFEGYLFFVLLWILWLILYFAAQQVQDQPLNNALYSSAALSIMALILRAVTMTYNGETIGLINDAQVWVFPSITALLASIIWAIKRR